MRIIICDVNVIVFVTLMTTLVAFNISIILFVASIVMLRNKNISHCFLSKMKEKIQEVIDARKKQAKMWLKL